MVELAIVLAGAIAFVFEVIGRLHKRAFVPSAYLVITAAFLFMVMFGFTSALVLPAAS